MKAKDSILVGITLIVANFFFHFLGGLPTIIGLILIGTGVVRYLKTN